MKTHGSVQNSANTFHPLKRFYRLFLRDFLVKCRYLEIDTDSQFEQNLAFHRLDSKSTRHDLDRFPQNFEKSTIQHKHTQVLRSTCTGTYGYHPKVHNPLLKNLECIFLRGPIHNHLHFSILVFRHETKQHELHHLHTDSSCRWNHHPIMNRHKNINFYN